MWGPVRVLRRDVYGLGRDGDGIGCATRVAATTGVATTAMLEVLTTERVCRFEFCVLGDPKHHTRTVQLTTVEKV